MTTDILMANIMNLGADERRNFLRLVTDRLSELKPAHDECTEDILTGLLCGIGDDVSAAVASLILREIPDENGQIAIVVPEFTETLPVADEDELKLRLNALSWYRYKSGREVYRLFDYFILLDGVVYLHIPEKTQALLSICTFSAA